MRATGQVFAVKVRIYQRKTSVLQGDCSHTELEFLLNDQFYCTECEHYCFFWEPLHGGKPCMLPLVQFRRLVDTKQIRT